MGRNKKKKEQVFKSMVEFEKEFLPKYLSISKRSLSMPSDARALGVSSAKESLEAIRSQLAK